MNQNGSYSCMYDINAQYKHMYIKLYHFRDGIARIYDVLRDEIQPNNFHAHAVNGEVKLLTALRFYATGDLLKLVGDSVGISEASASR